MLICGGRICGNCAMGRPSRDTTPSRMVRIAMTIATIGRRMKKLDTRVPSQFLAGGAAALATGATAEAAEPDAAADGGGAGFGSTRAPSEILCTPSTTILSPSA